MAKIPFGILGPIVGTVGPVVGKRWKDKATISSKRSPAKTDTEPTPSQEQQRSKFGLVSHFLRGIRTLVKSTFRELATSQTEFQCAMSYNMCNAVSGSSLDYKLHYELVSVGRGTLPNAVAPEAKVGDSAGEIRFLWADNTGIGQAAATDTAIAVAYCPAMKDWVYQKTPEATRADGATQLSVPRFSGKTVHTWLAFISDAGKSADSVYTGELVLG